MSTQPEALRLADEFERPYWDDGTPHGQLVKAAAELRRLHAINAELVEALKVASYRIEDLITDDDGHAHKEAEKWLPFINAALAKAEGREA